MKVEITGRPISKKNSRQAVYVRGRTIMIPSKAYNAFRISAMQQLGLSVRMKAPYFIRYEFHMKGRLDTDIDNMIAGLNDILQECSRIDNDKNIMAIEAVKIPRCKDWKTVIEIETYATNTDKTKK